jgi:hypothetical protein
LASSCDLRVATSSSMASNAQTSRPWPTFTHQPQRCGYQHVYRIPTKFPPVLAGTAHCTTGSEPVLLISGIT